MHEQITELIETIKALRDPSHGCPWDLEQTHESLLDYLIEESYEYVQAVRESDKELMSEELGDILLQVLLHAQIASENNDFDFQTICQQLNQKIIKRHPHVFNKQTQRKISKAEVIASWEKIKTQQRGPKQNKSLIKDKLLYAPPLMSAYKIGKRSKEIGFDWASYDQVYEKVKEELAEVKDELEQKQLDETKLKEEIGDLLFSVVQLARHLNIHPSTALESANTKFFRRFRQMEQKSDIKKVPFKSLSIHQKEILWKEVKKDEKK